MKLIVGLGNPGSEYVGTRHNIGFDVIEELAARLGWAVRGMFPRMAKKKFDSLAFDGTIELASGTTEKLLLLEPMTFMNLSGNAVQSAMAFYRLEPSDIMVVLDDLALPCGRIRLRSGGSDGGHNGLKDIKRALGTDQYPRLRVGIDPAPPRVPGRDYVLGRFTEAQRQLVDPAVGRACGAIVTWADKGIAVAMNQFNTSEKSDTNDKPETKS